MENPKLFLIIKKNNKKKEPIQSFIESNFERAKEYFYGYCYGNNDLFKYELRWIGTFNTDTNKLNINNIFITGGFENNAEMRDKNKKKINQLKFLYNEKKNTENKLKEIFNGETIE